MSYCCVGGCSKRNGGESDFRRFIRFYRFPKKTALLKRWIARVNRVSEHLNPKSLFVCSEHFEDDDFVYSSLLQADLLNDELLARHQIKLKDDAVPNTDRRTGNLRLGRPSATKALKRVCNEELPDNQAQPSPSNPRKRPRNRRAMDAGNIDELIEENRRIVEVAELPLTPDHTSSNVPTLELDVSVPSDVVLLDSAEPSHKDQSVQHSPLYKTRLIQVGKPCESLKDTTYPGDLAALDSPSDDDLDEVNSDPDYIPLASASGTSKELDFTRSYSFKSKTTGKMTHVSYPISKVIVGCQQLKALFNFCSQCGDAVEDKSVHYEGALITVNYTCKSGHAIVWRSGDIKHRQSLINVELVGSARMSGIGFTGLQELFRILEMPIMSANTFYELANKWIYPVFLKEFSRLRTEIITELKITENIVLCGDAQFDSPGFSAKYCTYTVMDCSNDKVVDTIIIQKGQYEGELEKQACRELLNILISEDQLSIAQFVNDRHQGIGKMMREEFPDIYHGYDVWHMAKSLRKKFTKAAKKHPKIAFWSEQLINHFWWSCENCKKNPELLLEMFHSCLFHVLNIHRWDKKVVIHRKFVELKGKRPYPKPPTINLKCWHTTISNGDARTIKWFKVDDEDFKALFKVITGTKFSNDVKKCSEFLHTGALESLHSTKIKYLPKSTAYTMDTSILMMMFVVLIHNSLQGIAPTKRYEVRDYSRASKKYRIKTKVIKDILPFKKSLLSEMTGNVRSNTRLPIDLSRYIRRAVPKTFHGVEKPALDDLKKKQFSRMGKQ